MSLQKVVSAVLILFSSFDPVRLNVVKNTTDNPWDVLIFTQSWPPTVCKEWKANNPRHSCKLPADEDSWTIHGIWPTKFHTKGPFFCNRTWHFDPEAIKPIEGPLLQYWANIEAGTSVYSLWSHEWSKHGTCAAVLEPLNSELKYFSKGLDLLKKYSMLEVLNVAGITPSETTEYNVADINKAIVSKLGTTPAIECRKLDGKSVIVEIRICFDKKLKLSNCDGIVGNVIENYDESSKIITNCDVQQGIIYPKSANMRTSYHQIIVQFYKLITWLQWLTF